MSVKPAAVAGATGGVAAAGEYGFEFHFDFGYLGLYVWFLCFVHCSSYLFDYFILLYGSTGAVDDLAAVLYHYASVVAVHALAVDVVDRFIGTFLLDGDVGYAGGVVAAKRRLQ